MSLSQINSIILSSQPTQFKPSLRGRLSSTVFGGGTGSLLPPNRSLIQNTLPKAQRLAAPKGGVLRNQKLPSSFTWRGNSLILDPKNQSMCGSCWAFAASTMFSDVIAIATGGKLRPDISPTYLLSCNQQLGCGGGMPTEAIKDIVSKGIVYSDCIDYSWCERNKVCSGSAMGHFNNPTDYLNSKIPACLSCKKPVQDVKGVGAVSPLAEKDLSPCSSNDLEYVKCLQSGGKVNKYFGKNDYAIYAETDSDGKVIGTQLEDVIYDMKEQILNKGPIVGSYFILSNFMGAAGGTFSETDEVYIENYPYKNSNGSPCPQDNTDKFNPTPYAINGGHAVVLVGYGEKDISAINPVTNKPYGKVGYWEVRNSWGTSWGDGGYFKMAQYPVNKFSQFDVGINLGNGVWMGGTSMCEFSHTQSANVLDDKVVFVDDENDDKNYKINNTRRDEGSFGYALTANSSYKKYIMIIIAIVVLYFLYRRYGKDVRRYLKL